MEGRFFVRGDTFARGSDLFALAEGAFTAKHRNVLIYILICLSSFDGVLSFSLDREVKHDLRPFSQMFEGEIQQGLMVECFQDALRHRLFEF